MSLGLDVEILSVGSGKVVMKVAGKGAAKAFKHESGKHVVQRYPKTESKGRRHTSTISVSVLPMLRIDDRTLSSNEITVKTQGGSGPGGQHQNRTASAVRMTHNDTGLQVLINGRCQHANRREALDILTARVNELERADKVGERNKLREQQMGGGSRGDKVRTYNFIDGRVVDHKLGKRTAQIGRVMKGQFDLLLTK
jgi:peptide chain release factor 1